MTLSDGEKLILVMLSDIYKKLGINGEINPELVTKAICHDHAWALTWEYDGILNGSRDDNPPIVNEVVDILTMWRVVEQLYNRLPDEDKEKIKDAVSGQELTFYGFDGNEETEHMSVAQFLIEDLGRFTEFKGRDLNSHRQTLPNYKRMLAEHRRIRDAHGYYPLSADELLRLFSGGCA